MSRIEENLKRVCEYLDSQEWKYDVLSEKRVSFRMGISSQLKGCTVFVTVSDNDIMTYAVAPINANENSKAAVAEFITRANYGLKVGNFEMDYSDGEVRYKTRLSCMGRVPELDEVEVHVDLAFMMLRRYGDGLLKNMLGFGNPEKDIAEIEG